MALRIVTPPSGAVVSLPEAKRHLRVEGNHDDADIAGYIYAATDWAERTTGRALTRREYQLTVDGWPAAGEAIELPYPPTPSEQIGSPLSNAVLVEYVDPDGVTQTLAESVYVLLGLDDDTRPARIILAFNQSWPSLRAQPGSVIVTYTTGYKDAAKVPSDIRQAVLMKIGTFYLQRESMIEGGMFSSDADQRLLFPYRVLGI